MYKDSYLRAAIGAVYSSINSIGYWAADAIKNVNYSYGVYGNSNVSRNISSSNINHSTPVKRQDGSDPSLVQPYITVYFWKRTA